MTRSRSKGAIVQAGTRSLDPTAHALSCGLASQESETQAGSWGPQAYSCPQSWTCSLRNISPSHQASKTWPCGAHQLPFRQLAPVSTTPRGFSYLTCSLLMLPGKRSRSHSKTRGAFFWDKISMAAPYPKGPEAVR